MSELSKTILISEHLMLPFRAVRAVWRSFLFLSPERIELLPPGAWLQSVCGPRAVDLVLVEYTLLVLALRTCFGFG